MSQTSSLNSSNSAMPRRTRVILWAYIAFNLLIAGTVIGNPAQIDATYRGGPMPGARMVALAMVRKAEEATR